MNKLHDELCLIAAKFLSNNGFSVVFDDRFFCTTGSGERPDAIGFRNGVSCLIEVKTSRSDFLKDKNKIFRQNSELGMGDWRFFMSPDGVLSGEDIPIGWGLLEVKNGRVYKTLGFPKNTQWFSMKPFQAHKQSECDYLYSALRRLSKSGVTNKIYMDSKL